MPRDFSDGRLGDIYAGICRMAADRVPIDYLTVWDQLNAWDVRGIDLGDLSEWVTAVPSASNASYYATIVREAGIVRSLRQIGTQLMAVEDPGLALNRAV